MIYYINDKIGRDKISINKAPIHIIYTQRFADFFLYLSSHEEKIVRNSKTPGRALN